MSDKRLPIYESSINAAELNSLTKKENRSKRKDVRKRASKYSGIWKGILYQPDGTLRAKFNFSMRLYQKGKKISGFSRIAIIGAPEYFGVMRLKGTVKKNRLSFMETETTKQNFMPDSGWCIKSGKLKLASNKGKMTLTGKWRGGENCSPGTIVLRKISRK